MERIAIVEDTQTKARLIQGIFENASGFEIVSTVHTISEAQTIPSARPDIVLVDRMLPDGDGLALADDLSQRLPDARVYLYSSSDPPPILPGGVGYLRDKESGHWPAVLSPPRQYPGVFVRHPKKA